MQLSWFQAESNKSHRITVPVNKFAAALRANWRNKYRAAKVFRLYTKEDFDNLPERSVAKMRRTDLCSVILYLKTLAVDNILRFDFPSPPPAKNVLAALETLYALGKITVFQNIFCFNCQIYEGSALNLKYSLWPFSFQFAFQLPYSSGQNKGNIFAEKKT